MSEKLYTYTWTSREGNALLRLIKEYMRKNRERQRRYRARKKARKLLFAALNMR